MTIIISILKFSKTKAQRVTQPEDDRIRFKPRYNEKVSKVFEPDDKGLIDKPLKIRKKSTIFYLKMVKDTTNGSQKKLEM